jgi:YidC/Oxa1 family membrane protein insertase
MFMNLVSFTQMPVLITWFLSIRFVSGLPEIYPQIQSEGILWFTDLSTYDPYFILPIISAFFTYYSINKSLAANSSTMVPIAASMMPYLR